MCVCLCVYTLATEHSDLPYVHIKQQLGHGAYKAEENNNPYKRIGT